VHNLLVTCSGSNSLESLYKLQKRAVRVISFANYHDHSKPLFLKLDILNIYLLCLNQILIFVYKSLNSWLPSHCTNYFIKTADVHSHQTRGHEYDLYLNNAHKKCRINSLTFRSWKLLPNYIKNAPSHNIFKRHLKKHLLSEFVWCSLIIKFCHLFTMLSRLLISLSLCL